MGLRVLSLFDGISCGRVALERAGIDVDFYFASEIDKHAIAVTQKNYPDTIQIGDVNDVNFEDFKGGIDLLIGGSPCTNLSVAGNGTGLEGNESKLFFKFVEALNTIKPKYFLLENVKMKKEWEDIITTCLGVEPVLINSALVSAQNRKRLYWCNWEIPEIKDRGIHLQDILESGITEREKSLCLLAGYNSKFQEKRYLEKNIHQGIFKKYVRIGDLGNNSQGFRVYSVKGKSVCLMGNAGGLGGKTGLYKIDIPDGEYVIRKLRPVECERLQTLPDGYTEGISDNQRYKCCGNGWTVDVIAEIFKGIKI